jgi:hypothetical protein
VFGGMPRSRVALETGMHSPWVSRLLSEVGHEVIVAHARNVKLIGESRKKDDRIDAQNIGAAGADRSPVAVSGETSQRESAGRSDGDSGASGIGASADGAGEHGPRTVEELRRTIRCRYKKMFGSEQSVVIFATAGFKPFPDVVRKVHAETGGLGGGLPVLR